MSTRNPIPELSRKWGRASDLGRGMRLSADDMDALNAIGVGELIGAKASEVLRQIAIDRQAQRESAAKPTTTTDECTLSQDEAASALSRALEASGPQRRQPTAGKGRRKR